MRGRARVLSLDSLTGDWTSPVVDDVGLPALAADDTWRFTWRLVCGLLDQCEHAERTVLTRLGWPTQLAAIDDALAGRAEAPPPPLNRTDRSRVVQALHALAHISQARSHLAIGAEQAHLAA